MKVAFLWEQYSWGGVDTHSELLLEHFEEESYEIDVISNQENEGWKRISKTFDNSKNIKLKYIKIYSQAGFVKKYGSSSRFIRSIAFILFPIFLIQNFFVLFRILNSNYDVLLSQNGSYPGGWSCLLSIIVAKVVGIKKRILIIHHSTTPRRKSWYPIEWIIDQLVYKYSSSIVSVSHATKESYLVKREIKDNQKKCIVIYNGIKTVNNPTPLHLFNKLKVCVGIMGRCEERKGHLDLVEAIGLLSPLDRDKFHFYIIGYCDDSFKKRILGKAKELRILDNITICGYLAEPSQVVISNLDILCCLTRDYEGFGLTVIEAMTMKKSVITTTVGALAEFVKDKENALVVNPSCPVEVAKALEEIVFDQDVKSRIEVRGYETSKMFEARKMNESYYNLLF